MNDSAKLRLAVIYGGRSGEHEVSLKTAAAVIGALDFSKYEVTPVFISKQGEWRTGKPLPTAHVTVEQLVLSPDQLTPQADVFSLQSRGAVTAERQPFDVVFPLLHGTFGEDGTIQGFFEMAGIPYVGTGVLASAIGMDKVMMKKVFAQAGLPQCKYVSFTRAQWQADRVKWLGACEQELGYPCFVKPANSGSSVGISKAKAADDLVAAIELALTFDRKVIIEQSIDARELEVSVLGNDDVVASVVGEIIPSNEFYDYQAKYLDGKSVMVIPAQISADLSDRLRALAIAAFRAIDGSGLSRVDFFVEKTSGAIYINEINTMPGFTPFSMYPLLWQESGKHYGVLLDELIQLALQRFAEKTALQFSYE
jgi:D-alanine-D-alanine ligase